MSRIVPTRRLRSTVTLAGLVAVALLAPRLARGETIYLRDGRKVEGQVVERSDGKIEIVMKHGGLIVDRSDVVRVEGASPKAAGSQIDTVYLTDERVVSGDVTISLETHEVIVSSAKGESRFPRALVKAIKFRTGKTQVLEVLPGPEVAPVGTLDDTTENQWRTKIDKCITILRSLPPPLSDYDDKDRAKARQDLFDMGVFAVPYVRATIAQIYSEDQTVRPVLLDVLRVAELKAVVPAQIEDLVPGICQRLIDEDEAKRVKALQEVTMADGDDAAPLLLYLIQKDPSPRVKANCVGQLAVLKKFEELGSVLKMQEHGQLRLVAAFELGDNGYFMGIPVIIEALKLDGPQFLDVRTTAINALRRYTGQGNLGYLPESDDKDERAVAVARWEAWWKTEGQTKLKQSDRTEISDQDRATALDRWRDGNKVLNELEKKEKEAADSKTKLDPKDLSYAYETAAYLFKQALDADPTLSSARLSRAIILYEQLGRSREAEGELKLVLNKYAADDAKFLRFLATTHLGRLAAMDGIATLSSASWKKSESYYSEAAHLEPLTSDSWAGMGDSFLERALLVARGSANVAPVSTLTPGSPLDDDRLARERLLASAQANYKKALDVIDQRQHALSESASDLAGGGSGEVEDWKQGRLRNMIREDRDTLVKKAASVWFRLGRVELARQDKKEALAAFQAARSLDSSDPRYKDAAAFWERESREEKP
jgi:tetratricopeptide (TPR) repeat protein